MSFYVKICELCPLISQRILNQKKCYRSVLKSSQDQLQEYAIKNDGSHF